MLCSLCIAPNSYPEKGRVAKNLRVLVNHNKLQTFSTRVVGRLRSFSGALRAVSAREATPRRVTIAEDNFLFSDLSLFYWQEFT